MSLVKEIEENGATLAWSPLSTMPNCIALGTKDSGAGGFDDYGGKLELHRLDFKERGLKCPIMGSVKTSCKFSSLAWSPMGNYSTDFPSGLLAGGMTDGTINLWDPAKLMATHPQSQLSSMKHHSGAVTVDFNPNNGSTHLLASGGADASVLVHALDRPDTPKQPYLPAPDPNAAKHNAEISKVAWNSQVAHILASSSINGSCHIWDLRQKKSWCELRDAKRGSISDVCWNPSEGFQIVTSMGDDTNPVINMYDLRSSTTMPLSQLVGHQQGILSMSWCPADTSLLLSCGKDGHTYLWDLYERRPVYEFVADTLAAPSGGFGGFGMSAGRRYQVSWSPKQRATLASCSFDRKVQVYSMSGTRTHCSRAPKWLRRPTGASFGFGGKMISFHGGDETKNQAALQAGQRVPRMVCSNTVIEDQEVVEASKTFESIMEGKDYKSLCESKALNASQRGDEHEASIWRFIQLVFEDSARSKLLVNLGFDPAKITKEVNKFVSTPNEFTVNNNQQGGGGGDVIAATSSEGNDGGEPSVNDWIENNATNTTSAEDLFGGGNDNDENTLKKDDDDNGEQAADEETSLNNDDEDDKQSNEEDKDESLSPSKDESPSVPSVPCQNVPIGESEEVRKALLIGNFSAAVDGCFHRGQYADALLLASCGGAELWDQTRRRFFEHESNNRPYLHIVKAVINSQLSELVSTSNLNNWKQTLAILSTYAKSEEFSSLCEQLGSRLENELNDMKSSSLCYLCAINVPKTVEIWVDELNKFKAESFQASNTSSSSSSRASMNNSMALHALVEKVIVFAQGEEGNDILGPKVAELFTHYGALLANQGEMVTAAKYINADDEGSMELRHRLFFASQMDLTGAPHPPLPFQPILVGLSPSITGVYPAEQQPAAATPANAQTIQPQTTHQVAQPSNNNDNGVNPNTGLPIGWIWQTDPNSGAVYYVNTMTGVTQWEPPQPPAPEPTPAPQPVVTPAPQPAAPMVKATLVAAPAPVSAPAPTHSNPTVVNPPAPNNTTLPGLPKTDGFKSGPGPKSEAYVHDSQLVSSADNSGAAASMGAVPAEYDALLPAVNDLTARLTPVCTSGPEKKQLAEAVKASNILMSKLSNPGVVSAEIATKALQMVSAVQYADYTTASAIYKDLSSSAWDLHKDWVKGIKGFVVLAQKKLR
jgi:protein transport protein SEC31